MKYLIGTLLVTVFFGHLTNAQDSYESINLFENNWSFVVGVNIVDDSGVGLQDYTNIKENIKNIWNFEKPIIVGAEYYFNDKFSISSKLSFNNFQGGKTINGQKVKVGSTSSYVALDLAGKYSFRNILKFKIFDPFVLLGIGYQNRGEYNVQNKDAVIPSNNNVTVNSGIGTNLWFSKSWGLTMGAIGKFGLSSEANNLKQFHLGILYLLTKRANSKGVNEKNKEAKNSTIYYKLIKSNYKDKEKLDKEK